MQEWKIIADHRGGKCAFSEAHFPLLVESVYYYYYYYYAEAITRGNPSKEKTIRYQ